MIKLDNGTEENTIQTPVSFIFHTTHKEYGSGSVKQMHCLTY